MGNIFYLLFLGCIWLAPPVLAGEAVTLTIQLRATDGTPLVGEPVLLEQLPDAAAMEPACITQNDGTCQWFVLPGLYQVRFPAYTLDDISTLALAEGGLSGLGITVGESAIRYAFTVQADDHVYFDATPDAAAPTPRLPTKTGLSGGVIISPAMSLVTVSQVITTPAVPETQAEANPFVAEPQMGWQSLIPIGGGIFLGLIVWLGQRYLNGAFTKPKAVQPQETEEVR